MDLIIVLCNTTIVCGADKLTTTTNIQVICNLSESENTGQNGKCNR